MTGSRDWSEWAVVAEALIEARDNPPPTVARAHRRMTLVHGACPMRNRRSADAIAAYYALRWNWTVEPHPADWKVGKQAGHWRNQHMVNLGADLLLAFFQAGAPNKGTRDCVDRAIAAGLTEIRCYGDVPPDLAKYEYPKDGTDG